MLLLFQIVQAGTVDGLLHWTGPSAGAGPGQSVPAGDLNGDGLGDLAIGVPLDSTAGKGAGAVYILLDVATTSGMPLSDIAVQRTGTRTEDNAGSSLAGGGDLDNDGYDDLLVSAPIATTNVSGEGKVYLVYGQGNPTSGALEPDLFVAGTVNSGRVGSRVYMAPDLNDDGTAEALIGAPYLNPDGAAGTTWLAMYHGRRFAGVQQLTVESSGTTADVGWIHAQPGTYFGLSAAFVPQESGEWLLAIGAPGTSDGKGSLYYFDPTLGEEGEVFLSDSAVGTALTDESIGLGWALSAGSGGLWAGTPSAADQAGTVVFLEPEVGPRPLNAPSWTGEGQLGWGLAAWEPGDGRVLAAGEPGWNEGTGRVVLYDQTDVVATVEGCVQGGTVGAHVDAGLGPDPWGNDSPWLAFSGSGDATWGAGAGSVWVLGAEDAVGADCPDTDAPAEDADSDGVSVAQDCDDADSRRFPGAVELCGDGVDNDCDETIDESCDPSPAPPAEGCAGGPGPLLLLIPALFWRRRRILTLLPLSGAAVAAPIVIGDVRGGLEENLRGPMLVHDQGNGPQLLLANYQGSSAYHSAGEVFLFYGIPGPETTTSSAAFTLYGDTEHDHVGISLAMISGTADILAVGADHSGLGEDEGGQILFLTAPLANNRISSLQTDGVVVGTRQDRLGAQLLSTDMNGDGQDELLATSPGRDSRMGGVWLLGANLGGIAAVEDVASGRIVGDAESQLGWRLEATDLDGDGRPELIVGAFDYERPFSGRLLVYSTLRGGETLSMADAEGEWQVAQNDCHLGWGIARGPETLMSAPWGCGSDLSPKVWAVAGMPAGVVVLDPATADWSGEPGDGLGASVAWLDDKPVLGMPGISSILVGETLLTGTGALGHWVGTFGDLDSDGVADLGATAPNAVFDQSGQGRAFILSGAAISGTTQSLVPEAEEVPATESPAPTGCNTAGEPASVLGIIGVIGYILRRRPR